MKKTLSVLICLLLGSLLFAENFKVVKVVGSVFYKEGSEYTIVEEGMDLDGENEIKVGLNSIISLTDEKGRRIDIGAAKRGILSHLCVDVLATKSGTLKKHRIVTADIAEPVESRSKGIATASTRASDAKEDFEWDE